MAQTISFDEFDKEFTVVRWPDGQGGERVLIGTDAEDIDYLERQIDARGIEHVWTVVEANNGTRVGLSGYHLVDKVGHFFTEKAATLQDEYLEVIYEDPYLDNSHNSGMGTS